MDPFRKPKDSAMEPKGMFPYHSLGSGSVSAHRNSQAPGYATRGDGCPSGENQHAIKIVDQQQNIVFACQNLANILFQNKVNRYPILQDSLHQWGTKTCNSVPGLPQPWYQTHAIEQLQSEQSYLLDSLHQRDQLTTRLLIKRAALEDRLPFTTSSREAKRIQKEVHVLSVKISESIGQERLEVGRLSELYAEIRQHQRQEHIQKLRSAMQPRSPMLSPTQSTTATGADASESGSLGMPISPCGSDIHTSYPSSNLSPLSPTFVPRGDIFKNIGWDGPARWEGETWWRAINEQQSAEKEALHHGTTEQNEYPSTRTERVTDFTVGKVISPDQGAVGEKIDDSDVPGTLWSCVSDVGADGIDTRNVCTHGPLVVPPKAKSKRPSLPSLKMEWL